MAREGQHDARLRVTGDAKSANRELQSLAKRQDEVERSVTKTNAALAKNAAAATKAEQAHKQLGGGFKGLTSGLADVRAGVLGVQAAVQQIDAFANRMVDFSNASAGARFELSQLAVATGNQATQFQLATAAANLSANSFIDQAKANEIMAQTATHADATGRNMVATQEAIAKALATGNADKLRSIGLHTDMALAMDNYAKATHRSTTQITLAEKQQIALTEVTRALSNATDNAKTPTFGLGHSFVALKNQATDALDEFGMRINEIPSDVRLFAKEVKGAMGTSGSSIADVAWETTVLGGNWDALVAGLKDSFSTLDNLADLMRDSAKAIRDLRGEAMQMAHFGGGGNPLEGFQQKTTAAAQANAQLAAEFANIELAAANSLAPIINYAEGLERVKGSAKDAHAELKAMLGTVSGSGLSAAEIDAKAAGFAGGGESEAAAEFRRKHDERVRIDALEADGRARLMEAEKERIASLEEAREAAHQRLVQRAAEARAAEEKSWAERVAGAQGASSILNQTTGIMSQAFQAQGMSAERAARLQNRFLGIQALGIGALEVVKAAAAFAGFNYVQGALHTAAAAIAFTQGGLLLSGALDRKGGGSSAGAGAKGPAFSMGSGLSGGPAANTAPGAANEAPVPPSPTQSRTTTPETAADASPTRTGNPQGGGVTINLNARFVDKSTVREVFALGRDMHRNENLQGVPSDRRVS